MVNNIGTTTKTLNKNLGETTANVYASDITILTGELELGSLVFDEDGTLGVISSFTSQNEFVVKTYALSIDIETILGGSY